MLPTTVSGGVHRFSGSFLDCKGLCPSECQHKHANARSHAHTNTVHRSCRNKVVQPLSAVCLLMRSCVFYLLFFICYRLWCCATAHQGPGRKSDGIQSKKSPRATTALERCNLGYAGRLRHLFAQDHSKICEFLTRLPLQTLRSDHMSFPGKSSGHGSTLGLDLSGPQFQSSTWLMTSHNHFAITHI